NLPYRRARCTGRGLRSRVALERLDPLAVRLDMEQRAILPRCIVAESEAAVIHAERAEKHVVGEILERLADRAGRCDSGRGEPEVRIGVSGAERIFGLQIP